MSIQNRTETRIEARIDALSPRQRALLQARLRGSSAGVTSAPADAIAPRPGATHAPLSFAQQRLWLFEQLNPGTATYNVTAGLRLLGPLHAASLQAAFARVVQRHSVLRTVFGEGQQMLANTPAAACAMTLQTIASLNEALQCTRTALQTPFDLQRGPLIRAQLLRISDTDHVIALAVHHIVADAWSLSLLIDEVAQGYAQLLDQPQAPELAPPALQYADYAAWQRSKPAQPGNFSHLAQVPVLTLAMAQPRPPRQQFAGASITRHLPAALLPGLETLGASCGASLYMTLMAAFQLVLHQYSGQKDFAVGSPVAGRTRPELEPMLGFFINMLALRADLHGQPTFFELLARVKKAAVQAFAQQDTPFEQVVEALNGARDLSHHPVFQVVFALQNTPPAQVALPGLQVQALDAAPPISRFDLELHVSRSPDGLAALLQYDTALFTASQAKRLLAHLEAVVQQAVAHPERGIDKLSCLSPGERDKVLLRSQPEATPPSVAQLLARHAAARPEAVAVVCDGTSLSYGALYERGAHLAGHLLASGLLPEDVVAICLPRSMQAIASQLAVMLAGGAFLPLEASTPPARLRELVGAAGCRWVLTLGSFSPIFEGLAAQVLNVDDVAATPSAVALPAPPAAGDALAYVIYTSGSTGAPKGVMLSHASLANLCAWHQQRFEVDSHSRATWVASPAFDASVWELWPYLAAGAQIHVVPQATVLEPSALVQLLVQAHTTHCFVPTVLATPLLAQTWPAPGRLRYLLTGGDRLSATTAQMPFTLVNNYGPTEATVVATSCTVSGGGVPPIGQPIRNTQCYVLNAALAPVGIGQPGELFIAGSGLARGYLNRPAMTAERFIPNPFATGQRLYRTGDQVCWREDGQLEFLGRVDAQLKLRGYRIEPQEISSLLNTHPSVRDCVVVAAPNTSGQLQLVAYVVANAAHAFQPEALHAWLASRLPAYMLPSLLVPLPALPLSANGKLDRAALPPPPFQATRHDPPQTPSEQRIAALWQDLLGTASVSRQDHFFALGGHSLLAAQVVSRLREHTGHAVPLALLFEHPQLSDLACALDRLATDARPTEPRPNPLPTLPTDTVLLSAGQRRWWFLAQLGQGDVLGAHISCVVQLLGTLDTDRLAQALGTIVARHEPLHTGVVADAQGQPQPVRLATPSQWPLPVEAVDEAQASARAQAEAALPFDLARGPLLRTRLLQLGPQCHHLVATVHHMAADGWSLGVLVQELSQLYQGHSLPALPLRYSEVVHAQTQVDTHATLNYWRQQLADVPALNLAPQPLAPLAVAETLACSHLLSPRTHQTLIARAKDGLTPFMLIQSALLVLLSRYSGQTDFALGTPVAGRLRPEWERLLGFFVNTLVLRSPLERAGDRVAQLWEAVRSSTLQALAHQSLAFDDLVSALQPERDSRRNPFFSVLFAVQNMPLADLQLGDLQVQTLPSPLQATRLDLEVHAVAYADAQGQPGWALMATTRTSLFSQAGAQRLLAQLEYLLHGMLSQPNAAWAQLPVDDAPAALPFTAPSASSWLERLQAQAVQQPNAPAYQWANQTISYAQLTQQAACWAGALRAAGVGAEVPVGVLLERGPQQAVMALAVWWAGGVYVPLDVQAPTARLNRLVQDHRLHLVLTDAQTSPTVAHSLVWDLSQLAQPSDPVAPAQRLPAQALYLLFTSGSTGTPKGVLVPDQVIDHLSAWQAKRSAAISDRPSTLQFAALSFDVSIQEMISTWAQGAALVGLAPALRTDPVALLAHIRQHAVQRLYLPVVMLAELADRMQLEAQGTPVREIITAGDALHITPAMRAWAARDGWVLDNQYGPTETHVVSAQRLDGNPKRWPDQPSIGQALPHAQLQVRQANGQIAPVGMPGELWIGGPAVARGYARQAGLTAQRFTPTDPGRAYRTGDRVRWADNGELQFFGRSDDQVKVRGYRVELGEVQAHLSRLPQVDDAFVLLQKGELTAQIIPGPMAQNLEKSALAQVLRLELRQQLPSYMVPTRWVFVDSLPRNAHGKIDKARLSAVDGNAYNEADTSAMAPQGPHEQALAAIWAQVLDIAQAQIRRDDDFFALGGHSLKATQLSTRAAKTLGVNLPLAIIFDHPVLRDLAAWTAHNSGLLASAPLQAQERPQHIPASFAQERLWLIDQMAPGQVAYNMPAALRLRGSLNVAALARSFGEIVNRHESLRTAFGSVNGQTTQIIAPPVDASRWPLPTHDLSALPAAEREPQARQQAAHEAAQAFDLTQPPLLRTQLLRLADDDHVLLATLHHITADGWSLGVLVQELSQIYPALCAGHAHGLAPLAVQYADFAIWQRAWLSPVRLEQELGYWREQLQGYTPLQLRTDFQRPAVQSYAGAVQVRSLAQPVASGVAQLARQTQATPFMVLLSAWFALLQRHSGQDDLIVGTGIASRTQAALEPLLGFFVNSLVMRGDLSGDPGFTELIGRVRDMSLGAFAHQGLPFEKLVEHLQPQRDASRHPLFQVAFAVQNTPLGELALPGLSLGTFDTAIAASRFDLEIHVWLTDEHIHLAACYATDLWRPDTIARWLRQFEAVLACAIAQPQRPLSRLAFDEPAAMQQVLQYSRCGLHAQPDQSADCVHRRFARIAQQQPEAVALVFEVQPLAYAALDQRANQLAHHLCQAGVAPGSVVALHVPRGFDFVVALLAVWKAGAAYVPLDPLQPAQRLARMLAGSAAVLRLTHSAYQARLSGVPTLCLDMLDVSHQPRHAPTDTTTPAHLAYVLYTSGSTGQPKGVMVSHASVDNLQRAQISRLQLTPTDRALQFSSPGFDASVSEICLGLLSGATLVLANEQQAQSPEQLAVLLAQQQVSVATLTPSLLGVLPDRFPALRVLLTAGEACPLHIAQRWAVGRQLVNAYGPTEATVATSMGAPIDPQTRQLPDIGSPLHGVSAYVLDTHGAPAPVGLPGQLWVGGAGVSHGYAGMPGLTAQRFVPDAFSGIPGARLYATGDLACWTDDGTLAYLGRADTQLKLRGQRVEPGEIEAVLRRHPAIREAVVDLEAVPPQRTQGEASLRVRPAAAADGLELWPSIAEHFVYDETMYHAMTQDEVRNQHYRLAFEQSVPGKTVVDVGTGADAILARMCVAAGAAHVYAIEKLEASYQSARTTVQRLGLQDRITVIHGDATTVTLPQAVDVCVSEIVGPIGGAEGSAVILNEAWRFIKPGGHMIPSRTASRIAAVCLPQGFLAEPGFSALTAGYTQKIFEQTGGPFDLRLCLRGVSSADLMSNSDLFEDLDHTGMVAIESEHDIALTITRDAFCAGLLVWLQLEASPTQCLDTLDVTCCWLPVYLPAFGLGLNLRAGDVVTARITRRLARNGVNPDFLMQGQIRRVGEPAQAWTFASPHSRSSWAGDAVPYRTTPFYQRLFPVAQASADQPGRQRLLAWVVTDFSGTQPAETEARAYQQRVQAWRDLYEASIDGNASDDGLALSGWNSSYTGLPMEPAHMAAWRDATVQRIQALAPRNVWEIGCGNGLLLLPLAPGCRHYRGTDFSATTIANLARQVAAVNLPQVSLDVGEAAAALAAGVSADQRFDTVVLNSVVQYFPGLAYLDQVLLGVAQTLVAGGRAFVGDVRGRQWLPSFHAAVAQTRHGSSNPAQIQALTRAAMRAEEELTLDPAYFTQVQLPGLTGVTIWLKDEDTDNELTQFRYDVTLFFGEPATVPQGLVSLVYEQHGLADLQTWLQTCNAPNAACLGLPNSRVAAAHSLAASLGLVPTAPAAARFTLAQVRLMAASLGHTVRFAPAASGQADTCDALFERDTPALCPAWQAHAMRPCGALANNPLQKLQEDELRKSLPGFLADALPQAMHPADYVFVDAMPRSASGKLDRQALPAPPKPQPLQAAQQASDRTELALIALWEDMLGTSPIGIHDNFFTLGGHSLLAVQLMARVRQQFGTALPLSMLLEQGTVSALAQRLRDQRPAQGYTPLVALRATGQREAVFCVHPGGGGALCYLELARHLPAQHPVYGIQARGLEADETAMHSVQEMAACYVAALRTQQSHGPYHLVGWSFGGHIAQEMAVQLESAGCTVGLLAVLDATAPEHVPRVDERYLAQHAYLAYLAQQAGLQVAEGELALLPEDAQIDLVAQRATRAGLLPEGAGPDVIRRLLTLTAVSGRLAREHQPRPHKTDLHFLRAAQALSPQLAQVAAHDPSCGWLAYGPTQVHEVAGNHQTMMQMPQLDNLASLLTMLLKTR